MMRGIRNSPRGGAQMRVGVETGKGFWNSPRGCGIPHVRENSKFENFFRRDSGHAEVGEWTG